MKQKTCEFKFADELDNWQIVTDTIFFEHVEEVFILEVEINIATYEEIQRCRP